MIGVVGASGKTGAHLVEHLRSHGEAHVGLSRSSERFFDWRESASWAPALEGVSALYLVKPPHEAAMVDQAAELLASGPALERVVLLSESGREEKPDDDLDRAIELVVENSDLDSTILRPNWFFQNFSAEGGYHRSVLDGQLPFPTGSAPMAWIDVRDIVEVARLALTEPGHAGKAYELTGSEAFGIDEVARRLSTALGRTITTAPTASPEDLRNVAPGAAEREVYLAELQLDVLEGRCGKITSTVAELTGHSPRTFDDFVAEHLGDWN